MSQTVWLPWMVEYLVKYYASTTNPKLQKTLGLGYSAITNKAKELGLSKKTDGKVLKGVRHSPATEFKQGMRPWNAGMKGYKAGGRSAETRFKPGQRPINTLPIGSYRVSKNGYLEQKFSNAKGRSPSTRWRSVHRLVWEATHGPVPPKHIVVFKPGTATNVLEHITLDKLECISRAENARRNHPRTKHPELAKLVQLKGAITRQVNRINRESQERNPAT